MTDLELHQAIENRARQIQRQTGAPFLVAVNAVLEMCLDIGTDWLADPDWKLEARPCPDIK